MTHLWKNPLLVLAVAAIAIAQTGNAMAQSVVVGTIDDIPLAPRGTVQAFYDPATGDVILSVGSNDLSILGVLGAPFNSANAIPFPGHPQFPEGSEIAFLNLPAGAEGFPIPAGVFNFGNILPADPSIVDLASFQSNAVFGGAEVQFVSDVAAGPEGFGLLLADTTAVPEPSSLSLLALAGLAAIARRRR